MKYTIEGFNQKKLIDLGLDIIDAAILRWYIDFLPKMTKIEDNGIQYYWVKYQTIINDLPCLKITNREVLARRFKKLVKAELMTKFVNKENGNFTCFALTEKYLSLVDHSIKKSKPIDLKVDTPIDLKVDTKDSSININSSIKPLKENKKENPLIDEIVLYFNQRTKSNVVGDKHAISDMQKVLKEFTVDDCKLVIDSIASNEWMVAKGYCNLVTIFRATKFAEKLATAKAASIRPKTAQESLHRCNDGEYDLDKF